MTQYAEAIKEICKKMFRFFDVSFVWWSKFDWLTRTSRARRLDFFFAWLKAV